MLFRPVCVGADGGGQPFEKQRLGLLRLQNQLQRGGVALHQRARTQPEGCQVCVLLCARRFRSVSEKLLPHRLRLHAVCCHGGRSAQVVETGLRREAGMAEEGAEQRLLERTAVGRATRAACERGGKGGQLRRQLRHGGCSRFERVEARIVHQRQSQRLRLEQRHESAQRHVEVCQNARLCHLRRARCQHGSRHLVEQPLGRRVLRQSREEAGG
mmetsp:Transcript_5181/g.13515  ORF Transcript_5181/g.13515 Transcript_5181/m.13515 type:complete len:214 (+) Transcript_5181:327-968(+)